MIRIISVAKRTVILAIMATLGLMLFFSGWQGLPGKLKSTTETPELTVTMPEITVVPEEYPMDEITVSPGEVEPTVAKENFFVEYRLERERTRGKQMALLREVIDNPSTNQDARAIAQEKLLALGDFTAGELELESMLKAKGFGEVAVFLKETGATVIVQAERLSPGEAGRIMDLVVRETGLDQEKIIIIPKS